MDAKSVRDNNNKNSDLTDKKITLTRRIRVRLILIEMKSTTRCAHVFPIKVVIAEKGTLVAGEAEHRQGDGYGNINADLASFDSVHECPGRRAICRENCRAIAIRIFIDDVDGLVGRVGEYARQNGSEYFFRVTLHRRLHTYETIGIHVNKIAHVNKL